MTKYPSLAYEPMMVDRMIEALEQLIQWYDAVATGPDLEGIMLTDVIARARAAIVVTR